MTILARLTIDDCRREARTPDKVPLDQVDRLYERRVVHAGAMPSPVEARVLERLAAAAILDTVTTLSPDIRVVMRATAAGFSNVEIARRLGIPPPPLDRAFAAGDSDSISARTRLATWR